MRKAAFLAMLLFTPIAAYAEPIPDYILDKDYMNCVGKDTDPNKIKYCDCVRSTMRAGWSLDDYSDMVMEQLKNPNQPPEKLQTLAKACFDKTQPQ